MRYTEIISEQENLRAWFAGSKVIDANGNPKKMYHGSNAAFTAFDLKHSYEGALFGPGFYFTDSPLVAGSDGDARNEEELNAKAAFQQTGYAFQGARYEIPPLTKQQLYHFVRIFDSKEVEREWRRDIGSRESWLRAEAAYDKGPEALAVWLANQAPDWLRERMKLKRTPITTPTVYPVYLSIKNPFEMDQLLTPEQAQELRKKMWDASGEHFETFENATGGYRRNTRNENYESVWEWLCGRVFSNRRAEVTKTLQKMGYDGIHHTGGKIVRAFENHEVWIAFYPNQIKSIFSRNFDPNSDDLAD